MRRLEWTDNARKERRALIGYIAKHDMEAAKAIDRKLRAAAESLLVFPRKGQAGRIHGTRDLFVEPRYRLIYLIRKDSILILSVLHALREHPLEIPEA